MSGLKNATGRWRRLIRRDHHSTRIILSLQPRFLLVPPRCRCPLRSALDMNKITCGDWLAIRSDQQQEFVRFWLSGY